MAQQLYRWLIGVSKTPQANSFTTKTFLLFSDGHQLAVFSYLTADGCGDGWDGTLEEGRGRALDLILPVSARAALSVDYIAPGEMTIRYASRSDTCSYI